MKKALSFLTEYSLLLIIGALIAAIYFGLQAMSDALGFGGVFDSIEYVLAVAGDAFGHLYNMIASLVDWITGIIDSFGGFLGFEFEIPKMGQMDTNSAGREFDFGFGHLYNNGISGDFKKCKIKFVQLYRFEIIE